MRQRMRNFSFRPLYPAWFIWEVLVLAFSIWVWGQLKPRKYLKERRVCVARAPKNHQTNLPEKHPASPPVFLSAAVHICMEIVYTWITQSQQQYIRVYLNSGNKAILSNCVGVVSMILCVPDTSSTLGRANIVFSRADTKIRSRLNLFPHRSLIS